MYHIINKSFFVNKKKRSYRKIGLQPPSPEHAPNGNTKAKVIIKWTNTRTTEQTEHWLSEWVNDGAVGTYNTVRRTISRTQPITTSDPSATAKPKGHIDN